MTCRYQFSLLKVYNGTIDPFDGISIDQKDIQEEKDVDTFKLNIKKSLETYEIKGLSAVWLKIPVSLSKFVEPSIKFGFGFHHCDKSNIVLTKWLLKDIPNKIPEYATHFGGVGGIYIFSVFLLIILNELILSTYHYIFLYYIYSIIY